MQDKDFDQLFKHRLENFEAEPSHRTWESITRELDGQKKRKRAIPSYWMAAASVVLLASASLWLYRPVEVIKLQGKADAQVAMNKKTGIDASPQAENGVDEVVEDVPAAIAPVERERPRVARNVQRETGKASKQKETPEVEKIAQVQREALLAKQPVQVNEIPGADVSIGQSPIVLAQNEPVAEEPGTESEPARQRIKSVGGLVNFVIAQVDKRDNKIIEFTDGDEGSAVSGINLGPIKFRSRNK